MPSPTGPVLVTGAFGNVGRHVLRALLSDGRRVVATDLRTRQSEKAAHEFRGRVEVHWTDLTEESAVGSVLAAVSPSAVLHLAAVIPPATYAVPEPARAVNVGVTGRLVRAVEALADPCRFVLASSVAVYGSRNPHTMRAPVTADDPVRPREAYGAHKVECERLVRDSALEWTILRLGVVVSPDMSLALDGSTLWLEGLLPVDGRLHAVDGRDVGRAFAASVDARCAGRTLLVAGDASTRLTQGELSRSVTAALGLPRSLPRGRQGDPSDDEAWFTVEWLDTTEAQRLLDFQHHTWAETLRDVGRRTGRLRGVLPLAAPVVRLATTLRSPYRGHPDGPAQVWPRVEARWGPTAVVGPAQRGD
jgi:nucleoside-diphosphate-sugar epimerase